jgi:hypothetical protein
MAEQKDTGNKRSGKMPSEKAGAIVADRQERYGHPYDVYKIATHLWSVYIAGRKKQVVDFDPADIANMMILLKMARETTSPGDEQTIEDFAGYADVLEMIYQREADRAGKDKD